MLIWPGLTDTTVQQSLNSPAPTCSQGIMVQNHSRISQGFTTDSKSNRLSSNNEKRYHIFTHLTLFDRVRLSLVLFAMYGSGFTVECVGACRICCFSICPWSQVVVHQEKGLYSKAKAKKKALMLLLIPKLIQWSHYCERNANGGGFVYDQGGHFFLKY